MTTSLFSILAVGVILAVILFAVFIMAFKQGLRLGVITAQGEVPKPIQNPVKAVIDFKGQKQHKREEEKIQSELDEILGYSRETALKAIKEARGLGE